MKPVVFQVNMRGYKGAECSLVGIYNEETRIIVLSRFSQCMPLDSRMNVTISPDARDNPLVVFKESDLTDAIRAYYSLAGDQSAGNSRIAVAPAERVNKGVPVSPSDMPSSSIERDGMDASGWKYRVQEITNKSMSILAICHYVHNHYEKAALAVDFATELTEQLANGYGVTI